MNKLSSKINKLKGLRSNFFWVSVFLIFLGITSSLEAQSPNWSVNPAEWQNNMSIIAIGLDDCIPLIEEQSLLAVFDDQDEIRGVQSISATGLFFMTAFSNSFGESLHFRLYDAAADKVIDIEQVSVIFIPDDLIGLPDGPLLLPYDVNPAIGNAGSDQLISGKLTQLDAKGFGSWTIIDGTDGTIQDPLLPNSLMEGRTGNTYVLEWTLNPTYVCATPKDTVQVRFQVECSAFFEEQDQPSIVCDAHGHDYLITNGTVLPHQDIQYSSNQMIELEAGFEVSLHASFEAAIKDCPIE